MTSAPATELDATDTSNYLKHTHANPEVRAGRSALVHRGLGTIHQEPWAFVARNNSTRFVHAARPQLDPRSGDAVIRRARGHWQQD